MVRLVGIFELPAQVAAAVKQLQGRGYTDLETYAPAPFTEVEDAVHPKPSRVRLMTLIGGLVGGAVGNALDQKDKEMAQQAAQRAFENSRSGESSAWQNPDSGNSGSITPTRTYQAPGGQYCREYEQDIIVGGQPQKSYGTACRQADGSWQIQG